MLSVLVNRLLGDADKKVVSLETKQSVKYFVYHLIRTLFVRFILKTFCSLEMIRKNPMLFCMNEITCP